MKKKISLLEEGKEHRKDFNEQMDKVNKMSPEEFEKYLEENAIWYPPPERNFVMWVDEAGKDLFEKILKEKFKEEIDSMSKKEE